MSEFKYQLCRSTRRAADYRGAIGAIAAIEYGSGDVPYFVFDMPNPILSPRPNPDYIFYFDLRQAHASSVVSVVSGAYVSQRILELGLVAGSEWNVAWVQAIHRSQKE